MNSKVVFKIKLNNNSNITPLSSPDEFSSTNNFSKISYKYLPLYLNIYLYLISTLRAIYIYVPKILNRKTGPFTGGDHVVFFCLGQQT